MSTPIPDAVKPTYPLFSRRRRGVSEGAGEDDSEAIVFVELGALSSGILAASLDELRRVHVVTRRAALANLAPGVTVRLAFTPLDSVPGEIVPDPSDSLEITLSTKF